ncbi:MAG: hypothetical protein FWH05_00400 [Oscillospiraceae bacterium]|nr:hypothetical protein [Oscillospiraceae bacterium]
MAKTKRVKKRDEKRDYEPRVLKQLVGTLETALDEDADEIEELFDTVELPEQTPHAPAPKRRQKRYVAVGIIAIFFALIGIISAFNFSVRAIDDITNQKRLKDEFAKFIYPVVITDPPEFESNRNIPPVTVISAAIWRIIISGQTDLYTQDMGMVTIPAVDVEHSARSLFGTGFDIVHQSVDNIEIVFRYDSEINSYIIPAHIRYMTYMPLIEDVSNIGELYTVKVYYVVPGPLSLAGLEFENAPPVKSMVYTVSRSRNAMTVHSIRFGDDQADIGRRAF